MDNKNIQKPVDWPVNYHEQNLEDIYNALLLFREKPSYKNKEILFSLVDQTDLNEANYIGEVRYTDYEVALINSIYFYASEMHCESVKIYLYRMLVVVSTSHKMMYYFKNQMGINISNVGDSLIIEKYLQLCPVLQLFYQVFMKYNYEKNQSFCDSIIEYINYNLSYLRKENTKEINNIIFSMAHSYIVLMRDLSSCKSRKLLPIASFSREEIYKLFELESKLINESKQHPYERPLKSVVLISVRNWVMRSRNDSDECFYKCISDESAEKALSNHEIWMKKINKLNDPREMKILIELINDKNWYNYDWIKAIKIKVPENHFVCSYSKTAPDEYMKEEYGNNVFGYKSDRISDILSPTGLYNDKTFLGDVLFYDVIYSKEEAKQELQYLCDLINIFDFTDIQKNEFLNEIMPYFYLSFKDETWKNEKERRYHIVLNNNIRYIESSVDDEYYKCKTSLYLFPDFIFGSDKIKDKIKINRVVKLHALSTKSYMFCNNCYQSDYDYMDLNDKNKCRIFGSTNISIIY